jgi:hypothetical protein
VFFASLLAEETFSTADELIRLLTQVTQRKTQSANRHYEAEKRAQRRTCSLGEHQLHELPDPRGAVPGADGIAEWQHLRQRLPVRWRLAFDLLAQGYSRREVAAHFAVNTRSLRRVLEGVRQQVEQEEEPEVVPFRNP